MSGAGIGFRSTGVLVFTPPGRFAFQLVEMALSGSYEAFSAFIRNPDARILLCAEAVVSDEEMPGVLVDLDNRQAQLLPVAIDDIAPWTRGKLRAIFEFMKAALRKRGVRLLFRDAVAAGAFAGQGDAGADAVSRVGKILSSREKAGTAQSLEFFRAELLSGLDKEVFPLRDTAGCSYPCSDGDLPEEWRIVLPRPPDYKEVLSMSPTRLDGYIDCPFSYYLRDKSVLGEWRIENKTGPMPPVEYGDIVHRALEAWGRSEARESCESSCIERVLHEAVDEVVAERFGRTLPPSVAVQVSLIKERLGLFAGCQQTRRSEGWVVKAVEKKLSYMCGHTLFHGKCDRIDFNVNTGAWSVIDYKTSENGVAPTSCDIVRGGIRWNRLQLPIYCLMIDASEEDIFADARLDVIEGCYCMIGASRAGFYRSVKGTDAVMAVQEMKRLVGRIEAGIFWPPSANYGNRGNFRRWIGADPAKTLSKDWICDQERRLAAF